VRVYVFRAPHVDAGRKLRPISVAVVVTVSVAAAVSVAPVAITTVAVTTALVTGKRVGHLKMLAQSRQRISGEGF